VSRFDLSKRALIAASLMLGLIAGGARAQLAPVPNEVAIGDPHAKVTVVEYASLGCPHCADWSKDVFPTFKKTYVDTGKVRFVLREMLFGNSTLSAAGFLAARCAGPTNYFAMVEAIFANQAQIADGGVKELLKVAETFGVTEDRFKACLQDEVALKTLEARADGYASRDKITGTPTFLVGEQRLEGEQTLQQLAAAVAAAGHH